VQFFIGSALNSAANAGLESSQQNSAWLDDRLANFRLLTDYLQLHFRLLAVRLTPKIGLVINLQTARALGLNHPACISAPRRRVIK
jgi:hypothetical protein